jgi:hypothetical protein
MRKWVGGAIGSVAVLSLRTELEGEVLEFLPDIWFSST